MPAKISKEVRQRIYELNKENHPVREILSILKSEGVKISDKSIYNIIKENAKNQSFVSIEVDEEGSFNESFCEDVGMPILTFQGDGILPDDKILLEDKQKDEEEKHCLQREDLYSIINQGSKKEPNNSFQ